MKINKQISQYLKSRSWFREYIYELHNSKLITEDRINTYVSGDKDVYSISEPLDWNRTKAGYDVWSQRNDEFFNWCIK